MAAALGVVVVVIALCGLASAAPARTAQSRPAAISPARLSKPDKLQKDINDHILPLLSPRRKSDSSKPQLQLTDLLSDPLKRRSKPFTKLAARDGKSRDKSPLHIFVADLPRGPEHADDEEESDDEDDDVSHDGDHEEGSDATQEADHEQSGHDEESEHEGHEDKAVSVSLEQPSHDLGRHDASNELEPAHDEEALDERALRLEDERALRPEDERALRPEDERALRPEDETALRPEDERDLLRPEDERDLLRPEDERVVDERHDNEKADDSRSEQNQEPESEDRPLDESLSTLQLLSQDIASALRVEQPTESTEDRRVLECVERREPAAAVPEPSVEAQESEARVGHAPADFWNHHYLAESRTGEGGVGWPPEDSQHVDPQKAYHLSFRFTKK